MSSRILIQGTWSHSPLQKRGAPPQHVWAVRRTHGRTESELVLTRKHPLLDPEVVVQTITAPELARDQLILCGYDGGLGRPVVWSIDVDKPPAPFGVRMSVSALWGWLTVPELDILHDLDARRRDVYQHLLRARIDLAQLNMDASKVEWEAPWKP